MEELVSIILPETVRFGVKSAGFKSQIEQKQGTKCLNLLEEEHTSLRNTPFA